MTIEVDPQTAVLLQSLREEAKRRGVSFDAYLRERLGETAPAERLTLEEMERLLDELTQPASGNGKTGLPPDFSRSDIYNDHD